MSDEEMQNMKIDNLIFKLNNLATERMELFDRLWLLENKSQELRAELLGEMKIRDKKIV